ncbi:hypothetical protein HII28_19605 [Planctomonas sp. JC2975]|uniref:hypothetical protein n=1 Tax=Planctomonas sp. JC2975 TaxID=2729626 RepID=UPI001476562F|nr:hypothetical protein [Planctomonas sp. JC2975]NNC14070.1 hypothetical protein [Planctomonas sp. JC2975]
MPNQKKIVARLRDAIGDDALVRLGRVSRPEQSVQGFVVAVGAKWALLQRTMDGGFFDGHLAIRLDEVNSIRVDSSFESTFARTQPEWPPASKHPGEHVDLDTTFGMLTSLLRAGELFGIERNKKYDATWIGVPNELTRRWLYIWEVRPDASWHEHPQGYRLGSLTMVTMNDHYQRGLAAVAGPAPAGASPSTWAAADRASKAR